MARTLASFFAAATAWWRALHVALERAFTGGLTKRMTATFVSGRMDVETLMADLCRWSWGEGW
jgi:hypothetical protein